MKLPKYKDIQAAFFNHSIVVAVIDWTKRTSFPGFFAVPIYDVVVFIFNELKKQALITRANAMAFSFFLALFPAILGFFTLLPYFQKYILSYWPESQDEFYVQLQESIHSILPGNAGNMLFETIVDVTTTPRVGLFSVGFILAIFFASNGIMAMMRHFNKSYVYTFKRRPVWKKRLIAINLTFLVGFLLFVSAVLIILGGQLLTKLLIYIEADSLTTITLLILQWMILLMAVYFSIAMIYRYGASTITKFQIFSPGAMLATLSSILSSVIFSFYVDNFGAYNKLYGTIGTIIVLMLWIQINAFILLVGFELNASIAVNRDLKKQSTKAKDDSI